MDYNYLIEKRAEVLQEIKPMCDAFKILDYDYKIDIITGNELLKLNDTIIGCASNSIDAVIDEVIGYLFINKWCRHRYLGTFSVQCKNVIKEYWYE